MSTQTKHNFSLEEFNTLLDQHEQVLVDFYAEWCSPCQMIAAYWGQLESENQPKVTFLKVDVEGSPEVVRAYGISAMPTLKLFKAGKEVESVRGALPKQALQNLINQKFS